MSKKMTIWEPLQRPSDAHWRGRQTRPWNRPDPAPGSAEPVRTLGHHPSSPIRTTQPHTSETSRE